MLVVAREDWLTPRVSAVSMMVDSWPVAKVDGSVDGRVVQGCSVGSAVAARAGEDGS